MATFFLLLIYLAFISLGLPDAALGAAWPVMRVDLGAGLDAAGLLAMIVSGNTIISSLACERVVGRFGAGRVTAASVLLTALALLGFGFAPSFAWLVVLAVPLGLGAGSVDAALNNYVALHYEARHMSWLHSFWGVGALTGPLVMAAFLQRETGWRGGYYTLGGIQLAVSVLLIATLPLWRRREGDRAAAGDASVPVGPDIPKTPPFRIPGVAWALVTFLLYCAAEWAVGLWASSYLVETRGFSETWAARGAAAYYGGITVGRFLNGFLTRHFTGPQLIRGGMLVILAGAVMLALPLSGPVAFAALLVIGLGNAPVYPCMIHETPRRFGAANSQKIIGLQMATAYCGTTFLPPLLGVVASRTGLWIFPLSLIALTLAMLACSAAIDRVVRRHLVSLPPRTDGPTRG